jgi:hypothetical protein
VSVAGRRRLPAGTSPLFAIGAAMSAEGAGFVAITLPATIGLR